MRPQAAARVGVSSTGVCVHVRDILEHCCEDLSVNATVEHTSLEHVAGDTVSVNCDFGLHMNRRQRHVQFKVVYWDRGCSPANRMANRLFVNGFRRLGRMTCLLLRLSTYGFSVVASEAWFAVPAILHWMCCPRTTEVTSRDVVTYTCDDGGVFDANAIFSVLCRDGVSFSSVSTCSEPTFSFVAVVRDAITALSLAGAVITCKTVSCSGKARTSSTGAALVCFQEGQS